MSVGSRYKFKVCVMGDASVGKTTTVTRFSDGTFAENYLVTVGVQHSIHRILVEGEKSSALIELLVWDIGGQEKFKDLRKMFYRSTDGVILMFDLTDATSFSSFQQWAAEVFTNIGAEVPLVIVGNKADLQNHEVDLVDADRFARELNAEFVVTSAKTGMNIGYLFQAMGRSIFEKAQNAESTAPLANPQRGTYG